MCILLFLGVSKGFAQIDESDIYLVRANDSTLSKKFIQEICKAARTRSGDNNTNGFSDLEALIIMAANTGPTDSTKAAKAKKWHTRFGKYCQCDAHENFPKGDFLRQVVHSNYRSFANKVGPYNELSLDLNLRSPIDDLTIYEYINQERIRLEAKHDNRRFEFQQDEEWRNTMFFYFLFAEYSVNK